MAIPIFCPSCREVVGIEPESKTLLRIQHNISTDFLHIGLRTCPGKGMHEEKIHDEVLSFFGWLKLHHVHYPETNTDSRWYEYVGPKKRWAIHLLYLVRLERNDHLFVNHKMIFRTRRGGLLGDGLAELGLE